MEVGGWTRNSKLETRNSNRAVELPCPQGPTDGIVGVNPPCAVVVIGAGLAKTCTEPRRSIGGGVLHEVLQVVGGQGGVGLQQQGRQSNHVGGGHGGATPATLVATARNAGADVHSGRADLRLGLIPEGRAPTTEVGDGVPRVRGAHSHGVGEAAR